MQACYDAVTGGVPRATVVDGREPHAVLLELFTEEGVGTQVLPGVETRLRKAYATGERKESKMTDLQERYADVADEHLRPAEAGADPRRGRLRLGRRRQAVPRPARRHRRQLPRPRPPRAGRGGHRRSCRPWATSRTSSPPSRRSRSPSACSTCSGGRAASERSTTGPARSSSPTPAPRPTRPRSSSPGAPAAPTWSPPRAPSTAAPWARSR